MCTASFQAVSASFFFLDQGFYIGTYSSLWQKSRHTGFLHISHQSLQSVCPRGPGKNRKYVSVR